MCEGHWWEQTRLIQQGSGCTGPRITRQIKTCSTKRDGTGQDWDTTCRTFEGGRSIFYSADHRH